jgi:hypothetical protein
MNLNFLEELNVKGHLTISRVYQDNSEEVIFDDHNIIVSGMGVALAHMFAVSGSNSILDYQIDRFQVGVSGSQALEVVSTNSINGPLTSLTEYVGDAGDVLVTSGHQIRNNSVVATPLWYGMIPQHNVTKVDANTVRYTIFLDQESCNNLTRNGNPANLNEIGLFVKNIKGGTPVAPILVAYRYFSNVRKTSDFGLVFRWSLSF